MKLCQSMRRPKILIGPEKYFPSSNLCQLVAGFGQCILRGDRSAGQVVFMHDEEVFTN